MRLYFTLFIVFSLFYTIPLSAQEGLQTVSPDDAEISFSITEEGNGPVLQDVLCRVLEGEKIFMTAVSDSSGWLKVILPGNKDLLLEFTKIGYELKSFDFQANSLAGEKLDLDLELKKVSGPVNINFSVQDAMDHESIAGVVCRVFHGDETLEEITSDQNGALFVSLSSDKDVVLEFSKSGYEAKTFEFQTAELAGLDLDLDVELSKNSWIRFKGRVLDKDTYSFLEDVEVVMENLSTHKLFNTVTDISGTCFFFLEPGYKYKFIINDEKFEPKEVTIDTDCGSEPALTQFCLYGFYSQDFDKVQDEKYKTVGGVIGLRRK